MAVMVLLLGLMILLFVNSSLCMLLRIFISMGSGLGLCPRIGGEGGWSKGIGGGMRDLMGFGKLVIYVLVMVSYLT